MREKHFAYGGHSFALFRNLPYVPPFPDRSRSCLQSAGGLSTVFSPFVLGIRSGKSVDEVSPITPVIKENALLKGLAFGGDNDNIVFAHGIREGFCPMGLECLKLQRIQPE
jgi:hypothetical protein